jgi:hypothetical protein
MATTIKPTLDLFHSTRPKITYRKKKVPTALRNQVWIQHFGEIFRAKCPTTWCTNYITPFSFEAGHDIPESKGGPTVLENLIPICSMCNKSMGNSHTFQEWCTRYISTVPQSAVVKPSVPNAQLPAKKKSWFKKLLCFS